MHIQYHVLWNYGLVVSRKSCQFQIITPMVNQSGFIYWAIKLLPTRNNGFKCARNDRTAIQHHHSTKEVPMPSIPFVLHGYSNMGQHSGDFSLHIPLSNLECNPLEAACSLYSPCKKTEHIRSTHKRGVCGFFCLPLLL